VSHTVFDYASKYSHLGLPVLPLHYPVRNQDGIVCSCGRANCASPAKHPVGHLVPSGLKNATAEPEKITEWFKQSPWNVGIVTGVRSGIVLLDIDPRHGGDESLAALERANGPLPETWRFLTGGGGEHVLFRHPAGFVPNSANKLAPGIDVRGEGGYFVAPPSRHTSGRDYAISVDHDPDIVGLAEAPPWLVALMQAPSCGTGKVRTPVEDWRALTDATIPVGQRNDTIARISGYLLCRRVDPHVCLDLMMAFNAKHCSPALSEDEVIGIVASISQREMAKRTSNRGGFRHV
jgi:hypothetical protein